MKHMKKLLSLLLVLCLVLSLSCTAFAAGAEKPLDGKTVILHSNDVHGAIDLYAAMAAMKADYEAQGAEVILADAGDYSQGTVYVSVNKGADAVTMMNATGYDVVTLGNHEFDYGYAQLVENMKAAKFQVLCADVLGADGKTIYDANTIIEKGGVKIGFFGLETPEAQTKANPKLIQGLKFLAGADGKELYNCAAAQVADLKAKGADLVVCLAHLGVDESSELLEALEASTYCTPESIGGFPQVAGMQFTVATYETYDKNDESYPNSTYYGPKTINRVTIGSINGKDFDPEATYAVITNNFVAGGGDTYYAFAAATNQFDTGLPLDEVVMEYITKELKGVIGETYAEPAGRIVVDQGVAPAIADVQSMVMGEASYTAESYKAYAAVEAKLAAAETEAERVALCAELRAAVSGLKVVENTFDDATSGWYKPAVDFAQASGLMSGMGDNKFAPDVTTTRAMVAQVMYELADEPDVSGLTCPLSDVDSTAWYADAVIWAYNAGVVSGYEDGTFRPGRAITRQEMAVMFYGMLFGTDSILAEDDIKLALGAFKDGDTVASWAREAVAVCYISGIMVGDNGSFKPTDLLSRAQLAQVFRSFYETQLTFALDELPAAPDQPSTPVQPSTPEQPSTPVQPSAPEQPSMPTAA